jgi:hypothetical protein
MSNLSKLFIEKKENDDLIEQAILDTLERALVSRSKTQMLQLVGTVPQDHPFYPCIVAFAKRQKEA